MLKTHPDEAEFLKPPPREFSPPLQKAASLIINSTSTYPRIWITILAQYIGMGFFAAVCLFLPETPIYWPIGFMSLAVIFHAAVTLFKHRFTRMIRRLVTGGEIKTITVLDDYINWSIQVNGAPQRRIRYEIDAVEKTYRTYDHRLADEFSGAVPVLIHPRIKFIIPLSFLTKYTVEKRTH